MHSGQGVCWQTRHLVPGRTTDLCPQRLSSIRLSGTLPDFSRAAHLADCHLPTAQHLDLSQRCPGHFIIVRCPLQNSTKLSGTLPDFSRAAHLVAVDLSDNALTGPLPQLPSTMVELMTLKLQENSLTGTLPGSWGKCCSAQIVFGMA